MTKLKFSKKYKEEQIQEKKKEQQKQKTRTILNGIKEAAYILLMPAAMMYLFEGFTHNPFVTMHVPIQFMNIFLFTIFELFLFFITGSLRRALHIEGGIFLALGIIEYYVWSFRGITILPWDLFSLGTVKNVASGYDYKLDRLRIILIAAFAVLFVLMHFCNLKLPKKPLKKKLLIRIIGALSMALVICGYADYVQQESTVIKWRMYDKLFTPFVLSKRDGTVTAFMMELQYMTVEVPSEYSADEEQKVLDTYSTDSTGTASENGLSGNMASGDKDYPNIIVVMDEAFSDPKVLGDFSTSEEYMPFVHSLEKKGTENTITGYMNVSIVGGNTPNTEFEFLTGNTLAFLPEGCIPFQQYVHHDIDAIPEYLASLGYSTTGMHPYYGDGWDRRRVYPLLGMQKALFIGDFVSNVTYIRDYIDDETTFEKIESEYEARDRSKPFFMFNVTMQNHSPYTDDYPNFNVDVSVDGSDSKVTARYLSLIKQTDLALNNLVDYFKKQDQHTIIVFFGDHQPTDSVVESIWNLNGKTGTDLSVSDNELRYKVPFVIWANYDIDEESGVETSVNYLGNKVLDTAGIPLYPYRQFLEEEEEKYPVISAIHVVKSDGTDSTAKDLKEELSDYRRLQYYELFDKTEEK